MLPLLDLELRNRDRQLQQELEQRRRTNAWDAPATFSGFWAQVVSWFSIGREAKLSQPVNVTATDGSPDATTAKRDKKSA